MAEQLTKAIVQGAVGAIQKEVKDGMKAMNDQNEAHHTKTLEAVKKQRWGDVDPDADIDTQIAQCKTSYCRYLVILKDLQAKKSDQKAKAKEDHFARKAAIAEKKKDEKSKAVAEKAEKLAKAAREKANTQKEKKESTIRNVQKTHAKDVAKSGAKSKSLAKPPTRPTKLDGNTEDVLDELD